MKYKKLGTTDINVSVIGLGTWQFSGEWGKEFNVRDVCQILSAAEAIGINFIDTAECYGDHLSEKLIGSFLKKNKNREYWVLATKFGHLYKGFLDVEDSWSPKEVKQQLEKSLKALSTDYIDIYQFHSGDNKTFNNDKLWETLRKEKQKGKIRYLGISVSEKLVLNNDMFQIHKAKEYDIDIVQVRYNWLHREAEKTIIPECVKLNLGILTRQPLAYGYLSGKYDIYSQFPENDVRYWLPKDLLIKDIKAIKKLRDKMGYNINMAKWSIGWCLKNKDVDSVIVGCKTIEQIKDLIDIIKNYEISNQPVYL
jgi:aryl-alcohol dehydrogenase-like predicted oxidoreductase